ncbi:MAG: 50S ribosomal protein L6 [Wolbachia endosymbiont of Tyrophagus putrescentiae]|nr:50S ribosomal protein L6 [Wolbachia endosymbiont of Tyrophagus putrescentiae]
MSRIGAAPINIPTGISVECSNDKVLIKSAKTEKEVILSHGVECKVIDNQLLLSVSQGSKPMWGTYRSNINNVISGMANDFSVDLEINGVGYKADCNDKYLTLYLGYSHNVKYKVPQDIQIKCVKPTHLVVSGVDRQKVYMVAADICKIRKYDPYKGKGIVIKGKFMLRKVVSKKK